MFFYAVLILSVGTISVRVFSLILNNVERKVYNKLVTAINNKNGSDIILIFKLKVRKYNKKYIMYYVNSNNSCADIVNLLDHEINKRWYNPNTYSPCVEISVKGKMNTVPNLMDPHYYLVRLADFVTVVKPMRGF